MCGALTDTFWHHWRPPQLVTPAREGQLVARIDNGRLDQHAPVKNMAHGTDVADLRPVLPRHTWIPRVISFVCADLGWGGRVPVVSTHRTALREPGGTRTNGL